MLKSYIRMMVATFLFVGIQMLPTASQASDTTQCQSRVITAAGAYLACATEATIRSLSTDRCEARLEERISEVLSTWEEACPNLDGVEGETTPFQELLGQRAEELIDVAGLSPRPNSKAGVACARKKARQATRYLARRARILAARVARARGLEPSSAERSNEKLERKLEAIEARYGEACAEVGSSPSTQVALNEAILLDLYESVFSTVNGPTPMQVTAQLNLAMRGSGKKHRFGPPQKAYSTDSGYGVLIRNFADGVVPGQTEQSFVVTSMLHNDINVPNGVYPYQGVGTGTNIHSTKIDRPTGQWMTPTLVGAWDLSPDTKLQTGNVQWNIDPFVWPDGTTGSMKTAKRPDGTWGYGVLYSHDSNSEQRARPVFEEKWKCDAAANPPTCNPEGGSPDQGGYKGYYDAPRGSKPFSELNYPEDWQFHDAPNDAMHGASKMKVGNPRAHFYAEKASLEQGGHPSYGAGAGIHVAERWNTVCRPPPQGCWQAFDWTGNVGDNMNTHWYGNKYGLWEQHDIMGWWGEANYALKDATSGAKDDSWGKLIEALSHATTYWTGGTAEKPKQWLGDLLVPWVNNFKDMINIQNALYKHQKTVYGFKIPNGAFQGWNEIPIDIKYQAKGAQAGLTPVAYAFILPQGDSSISKTLLFPTHKCPDPCKPKVWMGLQLDWYVDNGYIDKGTTILVGRQRGSSKKGFLQEFIIEDFSVKGKVRMYTVTGGTLSY